MAELDRHTMIEPGTGRQCMVLGRDYETFRKRGYIDEGKIPVEATSEAEAEPGRKRPSRKRPSRRRKAPEAESAPEGETDEATEDEAEA